MINLDEANENKALSPGNLLLQGRLHAGLTQEQIAKELYLTISKVNALELDDFDHVGPDTFIRGYIRAYSNILKIDGSKILAAYEQCINEKNSQLSSVGATPVPVSSGQRSWKFMAGIAIFFIGVWLISIWFFNSPAEKNYSMSAVDTPSLPTSIENFSVASLAHQNSSLTETMTSSVGSVEAQTTLSNTTAATLVSIGASSSVSAPVAVNTSTAASETFAPVVMGEHAKKSDSGSNLETAAVTKKNGLDEISFIFRAECWLEVSDSRGDVLATELQAAGSKLSLVGRAPFDVKLGNAPAVAIQLNNKKIDVIPVVGSRVLTLKIDE